MVYDPTRQWERYGAIDPYYGVLSEPDFHRSHLDEAARERFFQTGRRHIAESLTAIESLWGSGFEWRAALDFGCGVGRLTLPLAERCERVYGVDVSPSMLGEAARNARRMGLTNIEWAPAERLDELSGAYDLVHSHLVFQHIPARGGSGSSPSWCAGCAPGGWDRSRWRCAPPVRPRERFTGR